MRKQALRPFFGVFLSKLIQQSTGLEVNEDHIEHRNQL